MKNTKETFDMMFNLKSGDIGLLTEYTVKNKSPEIIDLFTSLISDDLFCSSETNEENVWFWNNKIKNEYYEILFSMSEKQVYAHLIKLNSLPRLVTYSKDTSLRYTKQIINGLLSRIFHKEGKPLTCKTYKKILEIENLRPIELFRAEDFIFNSSDKDSPEEVVRFLKHIGLFERQIIPLYMSSSKELTPKVTEILNLMLQETSKIFIPMWGHNIEMDESEIEANKETIVKILRDMYKILKLHEPYYKIDTEIRTREQSEQTEKMIGKLLQGYSEVDYVQASFEKVKEGNFL